MTSTLWEGIRELYEGHARELADHITATIPPQPEASDIYESLLSFRVAQDPEAAPPSPRGLPDPSPDPSPDDRPPVADLPPPLKIIRYYTPECHVLIGDKMVLDPLVKELGGFRYNSMLSCGKGWIFGVEKLEALGAQLSARDLHPLVEAGAGTPAGPGPGGGTECRPPSRVISVNEFGRHEDPETGLLFKQVEGRIMAYGVQDETGAVLAIPPSLQEFCEARGFPVYDRTSGPGSEDSGYESGESDSSSDEKGGEESGTDGVEEDEDEE